MKALFKSDVLQQQFEKDGFVKASLLSSIETKHLLDMYQTVAEAHERVNLPYITTSHSSDAVLIQQVDEILQKVLAPALERVLSNHKLLFGNYLVKMPGKDSETEPHQDITFVDESRYTSANVWVALQDTTPENGCMYFLRGSHKFIPTIRPTHDYKWAYENVKEVVKQNSEVFAAKAGEAFIFNHAIVHGSFANQTTQPRIAAVVAVYNAEASLIHYYLPENSSNRMQKYSMTKEAYLHFVKKQPPIKGVYLCDEQFDFGHLSEAEFKKLSLSRNNRTSLLQKVSNWFGKKD
jgi:hypothetical protein